MYAVLNQAGVLTGFSEFDKSSGIEVPDDCDLVPGRYKWDQGLGAFIPLATGQDRVLDEPDAMRAIYLGFCAIRDGQQLPKETLAWLDWYKQSFDNVRAK
jgi:hypothetical protein